MPDTQQNAVIAGSYVDLKFIRTRSTAQIVVEIPIERADAFLKMFGAPRPDAEIPVALARLALPAGPEASAPASESPSASTGEGRREPDPIKSARAKAEYAAKTPVEKLIARAAILCGDPKFWTWVHLNNRDLAVIECEEDAANWLKQMIGVKSRKEVATNDAAREKLLDILFQFDRRETP